MKIVIEIDDNLYTRLFDNGIDNYDDAEDMAKAIRKGTPLPKGHGRLIDEDEIKWDELWIENQYGRCCVGYAADLVHTPTIIEADKEVENETISEN